MKSPSATLLGILVALALAVKGQAAEPAAPWPAAPSVELGLARALLGAFNDGRLDAVAAMLDPEAGVYCVGCGLLPVQETAPIGRYLAVWRQAFPDLRFSPRRILDGAGYLVFEGVLSGTQRGELFGRAATGKAMAVPAAWLMWVDRGKLTRLSTYSNTAAMLRQLGLLAGPAPPLAALPAGEPEIVSAAPEPRALAAAKALYDDVTAGTLATIDRDFAPAVVVHDLATGNTLSGVAELRSLASDLHASFTDAALPPQEINSIGPYVIGRVAITGTQKAAFRSLPAGTRAIQLQHLDIGRISGGHLVEAWTYRDELDLLVQLGREESPLGRWSTAILPVAAVPPLTKRSVKPAKKPRSP